jgi:hypothetical protein
LTKGEITRQSTPRIVKEDEAMTLEIWIELAFIVLRILAAGAAG